LLRIRHSYDDIRPSPTTDTMTTPTRHAILFVLAITPLATACDDALSNCPDDEMESARNNAEPLHHIGCDYDDQCDEQGGAVCWDDARDAIVRHLENGEPFTLQRVSPTSPGGSDVRVWQVDADGSGTYYRRGPGGDVVEPGEEPSCGTTSSEFESVARDTGEFLELRVGDDRWRALPELRSKESEAYCGGNAAAPNNFDGAWVGLFSSAGDERSTAAATDASGKPIVGGTVEESVHGESFAGGASDGLLAKYGEQGNRRWTHLVGDEEDDEIHDVATDAAGNIYAAGTAGSALGEASYNGGGSDGFVAKFSASGERIWIRHIGTDGLDEAFGIEADGDGSLYVVGDTEGELGGQTHAGGLDDGFLIRLSTDGERAWTRLVGTPESDRLRAVSIGPNGDVGVVGTTRGALDKQAGDSEDFDGIAAVFDPSGKRQWLEQFGTPALEEVADVAFGADALYVGGETKGALGDGDRDEDRTDTDGFVVAYDGAGEHRWTRLFAGRVDDRVLGLTPDGDTLHVVGQTSDRLGGLGLSSPTTGFHARLSDSGNERSTRFITSHGNIQTTDLAVTEAAFYLAGTTANPWNDAESTGDRRVGYLGRFDR
jgi:hypothetical protein